MFYALDTLAPQDLFAGYRARIFHGSEITFAVVEIEFHDGLNDALLVLVSG